MKKEIIIDGVKYISADQASLKLAKTKEGMEYVLVRTYSAGVHVGYLKKEEGDEVTLIESRRIWYWDGANSISQLAVDGTAKPENCKFTVIVDSIRLKRVIEIIPCTEKSKESISLVQVWKQ